MKDYELLVERFEVSEELAKDWLKIRKGKGAKVLTETMINKFENQVKLSNYTAAQAIEICVIEEWRGFNSEWKGKHMNEWPKNGVTEQLGGDLESSKGMSEDELKAHNKSAVRRALQDINNTDW